VLDAEPDLILKMPGDSFAPFAGALALGVTFAGLLSQWWWLIGLGCGNARSWACSSSTGKSTGEPGVTERFVVILVRGLRVLDRCHALKVVEVEPDLLAIEYITDLGDETW